MRSQCRSAHVVIALSLYLLPAVVWGQEQAASNAPLLELKPKHVLKLDDWPYRVCFSRDGTRLACETKNMKGVAVWDTRTWKQVGGYTDGKFQLTVTELSPDGKTLAFTSSDAIDEVRLLDIATGKVRPALRGHTE